jgi:hypothetical protein
MNQTDYFSKHGSDRIQQRGITPFVVELLEDHGSVFRSGDADILIFDKQALKRLRHHLGGDRGLRVIDRWLKVYAILSDNGLVVTVGHRTKHISRH